VQRDPSYTCAGTCCEGPYVPWVTLDFFIFFGYTVVMNSPFLREMPVLQPHSWRAKYSRNANALVFPWTEHFCGNACQECKISQHPVRKIESQRDWKRLGHSPADSKESVRKSITHTVAPCVKLLAALHVLNAKWGETGLYAPVQETERHEFGSHASPELHASHESNTVIIILCKHSCRITYPMLTLTQCVSLAEKRYNHTSAGRVGVTTSYPTCTTLVQAFRNKNGQTCLRIVACLAQSYNEIQSPPPWLANQPQEESTKKHCDKVSTQHTHALPHKSTQMICPAAQQQRPTALPIQQPCCLAVSGHYRPNTTHRQTWWLMRPSSSN